MNVYTGINQNKESVDLIAPNFETALRFFRSLNEGIDPIQLFISKQNVRVQEEIEDPSFDVEIEGEGQVFPQSGTIIAGSQLILTALPDDGYEFIEWEIEDVIFTENPLKLTVFEDTRIIARFDVELEP